MLLLLSFIISIFSSFILLSLLLQCKSLLRCHCAIKFFLSQGLGFGLFSTLWLIFLLMFGQLHPYFIMIDIGIVIITLGIYIYYARSKNYSSHHIAVIADNKKNIHIQKFVSYAFFFGFSLALIICITRSIGNPHGDWDAWAIWNMHARFIFLGGADWINVFSRLIPHPDYPLLLPMLIARIWMYAGSDTVLAPIIVSLVFTFSTVGLLYAGISTLKSNTQGALAGLVLLVTPSFLSAGISQFADIPLSFFLLATLVLMSIYQQKRNNNLLLLVGLSLGFALFTKNEGLLFLMAFSFALLCVKKLRWLLHETKYIWIALAPITCVVLFIKLYFAPANDIVNPQNLQSVTSRLFALSRYSMVIHSFISDVSNFGGFTFNLPLFLVLFAILSRVTQAKKIRESFNVCVITIGLILIGYFFIYIITPLDLAWHLSSSLNRLLLQLWPSIIFMIFLILRSPEEKST